MDAVRLGDVGTWVQAIATALAVVFAWCAARTATRLYAVEAQRDRLAEGERHARDEQQRRAQAAQVAVWMETAADAAGLFQVCYNNTSQLPIFDAIVKLKAHGLNGGVIYPVLPPSNGPSMLPGATDRLNDHLISQPVAHLEALKAWAVSRDQVGVEIVFTDTSGQRWHRDVRGHLTAVDSSFEQITGAILDPTTAALMTSLHSAAANRVAAQPQQTGDDDGPGAPSPQQ